jgi:hypothetical protein
MTVYVDGMHKSQMGQFGRMKMSHLVADTDAELHAMVDKIGVQRRWFQGDHYDIAMSKRELAIQHGAVAIGMRELGKMRLIQRMAVAHGEPNRLPCPHGIDILFDMIWKNRIDAPAAVS